MRWSTVHVNILPSIHPFSTALVLIGVGSELELVTAEHSAQVHKQPFTLTLRPNNISDSNELRVDVFGMWEEVSVARKKPTLA